MSDRRLQLAWDSPLGIALEHWRHNVISLVRRTLGLGVLVVAAWLGGRAWPW